MSESSTDSALDDAIVARNRNRRAIDEAMGRLPPAPVRPLKRVDRATEVLPVSNRIAPPTPPLLSLQSSAGFAVDPPARAPSPAPAEPRHVERRIRERTPRPPRDAHAQQVVILDPVEEVPAPRTPPRSAPPTRGRKTQHPVRSKRSTNLQWILTLSRIRAPTSTFMN